LTEDAFERRFLGDQQKYSWSGKTCISWPSSEPSIESFSCGHRDPRVWGCARHDHCQCL
jgi:hypothetical protein